MGGEHGVVARGQDILDGKVRVAGDPEGESARDPGRGEFESVSRARIVRPTSGSPSRRDPSVN